MHARATVTVNRPPDEVYAYWRDFERLPTFMYHLESVDVNEGGRSHWRAKGPAGTSVEWDAELVDDTPGARIAWRSVEGSVDSQGQVAFTPAPGGRGTEVAVDLDYSPPGGAVGALVAKLFGEEPTQQLKDDLRRFKQVLETGEVLRSDASPEGTRTQNQRSQRDAQPMAPGSRA
ncbi:MAG: SRPBCC family protein [Acidimicrobiales bacterium]